VRVHVRVPVRVQVNGVRVFGSEGTFTRFPAFTRTPFTCTRTGTRTRTRTRPQ